MSGESNNMTYTRLLFCYCIDTMYVNMSMNVVALATALRDYSSTFIYQSITMQMMDADTCFYVNILSYKLC